MTISRPCVMAMTMPNTLGSAMKRSFTKSPYTNHDKQFINCAHAKGRLMESAFFLLMMSTTVERGLEKRRNTIASETYPTTLLDTTASCIIEAANPVNPTMETRGKSVVSTRRRVGASAS
eukprot:762413-Hanusia_phi.AAC.3